MNETDGNYLSVVCPHCGNEAARLRFEAFQGIRSATDSLEDQKKSKLIDDLDLSVRTYNALKNVFPEPKTVGDLVRFTERDLLRTKQMGPKSLNEIILILAGMDLSLAQNPANGHDI